MLFIYAELTAESKHKLESILPYKFPIHFGTHITLDWDVDPSKYQDLIGKKFNLTVDSLAFDDKIEALPVNLENSGLRSVNKNPHITWSASPEVDPYYSNYMLYITHDIVKFSSTEIEVVVKSQEF
jgi:Fungal tRNA ligase phosphodiesterase domain